MAANLNGVIFDQIYADNTGPTEFDTDGDGTTTQEDEFVSFTNTTGAPIDISGWQIWSDSTGTNSFDTPQDGLFHTFPPGTVLSPGETLYIINEISGPVPSWAQEASEGGVESGAGGTSTNLLSEGSSSGTGEDSIALVDPGSGDYIVFNMGAQPTQFPGIAGFPGTNNVGTEDGDAVQSDQDAGSSYRYNAGTDSYEYQAVSVPCFVAGTQITTPQGAVAVEDLRVGDQVTTLDAGDLPVLWTGSRILDARAITLGRHHPIEFKPGSLGPGQPSRTLRVSPQHRMLLSDGTLAPARGLTHLPAVRVMRGCQHVRYYHVLLPGHHIILAEQALTESLLPGKTFLSSAKISERLAISRRLASKPAPCRPLLSVKQARRRSIEVLQGALTA